MDFDLLMEYLAELVEFVKPVSGLVSDFFHGILGSIPELGMLFSTGKWILLIICVIMLFYRLVSD